MFLDLTSNLHFNREMQLWTVTEAGRCRPLVQPNQAWLGMTGRGGAGQGNHQIQSVELYHSEVKLQS